MSDPLPPSNHQDPCMAILTLVQESTLSMAVSSQLAFLGPDSALFLLLSLAAPLPHTMSVVSLKSLIGHTPPSGVL